GVEHLHDRLLHRGLAGRLRRRHRRADPLRLSRPRRRDAAPRPRGGDSRREWEPARLLRGQLHRRVPLQLRAGDVSRARVRGAVPPDARRARRAPAGPLRAGRRVKRLALSAALVLLVTVPWWVRGTFYVNIASQVLLYAIFALGVDGLAGYAGSPPTRGQRCSRAGPATSPWMWPPSPSRCSPPGSSRCWPCGARGSDS